MPNDADPLAKISSEYRVEIERTYPYPATRVWEAITNPEEISAWMHYDAQLEPRIGGRMFVDFKSEGNLEGVVCEWEPERVFAHTWGVSVVRWVLTPDGDVTHLHFTNSSVTPDIILGFAPGWHAFIDHLGPHMARETIEDRYEELMKIYEEKYPDLKA